jgi:trimeric autotransporter adhesin
VTGTLENSQCTVDAGASSSSASGNNLTVSLAVSFQPAYAGAKNVYTKVTGAAVDTSFVQLGTWAVP